MIKHYKPQFKVTYDAHIWMSKQMLPCEITSQIEEPTKLFWVHNYLTNNLLQFVAKYVDMIQEPTLKWPSFV